MELLSNNYTVYLFNTRTDALETKIINEVSLFQKCPLGGVQLLFPDLEYLKSQRERLVLFNASDVMVFGSL